MSVPVLYVDLSSPYAYLAAERAPRVLGTAPRLQAIVLGAIFELRGRGSWAWTDERAAGVAEVERRARAYGLPPLRWPTGWPASSLHGARAAVWAERHGAGSELVLALLRRVFAHGDDIADRAVVRAAVEDLGLPAAEMDDAVANPALKQELRDRTAAAWDRGVRGVPTLRIGEDLFYGDDRLEAAAVALAAHG